MKLLLNKSHLEHPWIFVAIRVLVGGIFLAFGIAKALEPQQAFYASIRAYEMIPSALVPAFATLILVAEIIFAIGMILGLYTRFSYAGIALLLVMFIIAIAQAMIRGLYLPDCGCSGSWIKLGDTPYEVIMRDVVMLIGVAWLLWKDTRPRYTLDSLLS